MKSEIKFLISKNKQLEEKLKVSEGKSDCQFEHIVKLEEKCKHLKELLKKSPSGHQRGQSQLKEKQTADSDSISESLEALQKKYDILLHSKEAEGK